VIQLNELRIKNFVSTPTGIKQIEYFVKDICNFENREAWSCDAIKPIPLTDEWLLRFGKKANKDDSFGGFIIYYSNGNGMRIKNNEWSTQHLSVKLEFVHQLQNLYYSLTQEELTLKQ
jgi:hypothetical protein